MASPGLRRQSVEFHLTICIFNTLPKVSVIIPVYKVEQYIECSVRSLMEQTLEDMEFIFINDGTPDRSIDILKSVLDRYPHRKPMVKIINHERNKGYYWAIRSGVEHSVGEYVGFCDPDDRCELDMFEKMYLTACDQNADIVVNNCFIEHNDCQKKTNYRRSSTPQECLRRFHQKDRMAVAFWRHLIRKTALSLDFFDRVIPPDHGTDLFVIIQVYYFARSIAATPDCLYHYRIRPNSITTAPNRSKAMLERQTSNISMIGNILGAGTTKTYRTMLNYLSFGNKQDYRAVFDNDREWFNFNRESHRDIWKFTKVGFIERMKTAFIFQNYHLWRLYYSLRKKQ
ncbi:MAG: glycosyltransferase family 2 protein [Bacteroidales bacterium]|nr:glycosyltransferase family 2 protein [Bacteroidales bacterium]